MLLKSETYTQSISRKCVLMLWAFVFVCVSEGQERGGLEARQEKCVDRKRLPIEVENAPKGLYWLCLCVCVLFRRLSDLVGVLLRLEDS